MQTNIEALRLRANPAYRAVAWNRLSPDARGLSAHSDGFGVLAPVDGQDLPLIAIDHDTALLFLSLQDPGAAPDFAYADKDAVTALRRLIFDSILQFEHRGRFISGPEACTFFGVENSGSGDALVQLSIEALLYGAALPDVNTAALMMKLYTYNRRPATPVLRGRLPDRVACLAFLGILPGSTTRDTIDRNWSGGDSDSLWLQFQRRQPRQGRVIQSCKLYVGLAFEDLVERLVPIVETLGRHETLQFKVGTDLDGFLRPDKFVAYFPSKHALFAAAQDLIAIVDGCKLHLVPFTAGITPSGALSWGMDVENAWLSGGASWRQWICEKLAAALIGARTNASDAIAPWRFALERLRLEGVDTDTFMPTGAWSGAT